MSERINFAMIGLGHFGSKRLNFLAQNTQVRLAGVYDIDQEKSRLAGLKFKTHSFNSLDEVLDAKVEAAIVSIPNAFHYQVCSPLLKNGIHVLCEKPLAHNVEEVKKFTELKYSSETIFQIGSNLYFFPILAQLKEVIRSQVLGKVFQVTASIGHDGTIIKNKWYQKKDLSGGGCFIDMGVHLIDYCQDVFGEFIGLENPVVLLDQEFLVEKFAQALFTTNQQIKIKLNTSWDKQNGYIDMQIIGEKGQIEVTTEKNLINIKLNSGIEEILKPNNDMPSIKLEIEYFINCIRNKIKPRSNAKMAEKNLNWCFQFYEQQPHH